MERNFFNSLLNNVLTAQEMSNVRGGEGETTPPVTTTPVKKGEDGDIIL